MTLPKDAIVDATTEFTTVSWRGLKVTTQDGMLIVMFGENQELYVPLSIVDFVRRDQPWTSSDGEDGESARGGKGGRGGRGGRGG